MKFQAPKGTRDFYPAEMARRSYILDAWRRVSQRNGFEQVDGPIFESLDLYKVKSGDGIVSELFHFEDRGGRELALRPEFTPTLARMVAAQANALPKPIKWFSTPNLCRAERPQRGRLREFSQWNVDILGLDDSVTDAECIFTAVDLMSELGLTPKHVRVKISHRQTVRNILAKLGVTDADMPAAFNLLDRMDRLPREEVLTEASRIGLDELAVRMFQEFGKDKYPCDQDGVIAAIRSKLVLDRGDPSVVDFETLGTELETFGIADWCEYDLSIVRGLAYYTGTVFEIHEASGAERAMAGGGRYDGLIKMFGGPATPAVGFGMGDVVLMNVLADKGLLPDSEKVSPRPDVFVIEVTGYTTKSLKIVSSLRKQGVHARFSYKTTRNLGKQLKEAAACCARYALIVDERIIEQDVAGLKNLSTGEQSDVSVKEEHMDDLAARLGHREP